jgi:hypothetical protein
VAKPSGQHCYYSSLNTADHLPLRQLYCLAFSFFFFKYWGLNSLLHTWQEGVLPFEPLHQPQTLPTSFIHLTSFPLVHSVQVKLGSFCSFAL